MMESKDKVKEKLSIKNSSSIQFQYCFDTVLKHEAYAAVVCELLKHLLYMRYQIPMPFVALQSEYQKEKEKWDASPLHHSHNRSYKKWLKLSNLVENFTLVLNALQDALLNVDIKRVVIMFGSTPVSPKESIEITSNMLVAGCYESSVTEIEKQKEIKKACRQLMRSVITSEQLSSISQLSPKSIFILISLDSHVSETFESNIFFPKINYRLPSRGIMHKFHLDCRIQCSCAEDMLSKHFNQLCTNELPQQENWYIASKPLHGYKEIVTSTNRMGWF